MYILALELLVWGNLIEFLNEDVYLNQYNLVEECEWVWITISFKLVAQSVLPFVIMFAPLSLQVYLLNSFIDLASVGFPFLYITFSWELKVPCFQMLSNLKRLILKKS